MQRLMTTMVEETKSRESAVQAHAALETEIENLTSNLFTEANKMVAFERLARARAEEKTRSVEEAGVSMQALLEEVQVGLKDTVLKLEERDAQVADLKSRLAAHGEHVEEDENVTGAGSTENDLGGIVFSDGEQLAPIKTRNLVRSHTGSDAVSPSPMAAPRLLTSVLPYQEFLAFINYLRQTRITALSRPPEQSSYPALGGRSFATDPAAHAHLTPDQLLAPHLLLSTHLSQAFLKRCVEEDSDPALRLDIAPGLGFLSRRSVANAIVDGSLVIEPLHSSSELPSDKCALCGCDLERWLANSGLSKADRPAATPAQTAAASVNSTMRKISSSFFSRSTSSAHVSPVTTAAPPPPPRGSSTTNAADDSTAHPSSTAASHHPHDAFLLAHVFRTSDKSQSQRYPICPSYCLPRLRAVCEFWTYVRVLLRGLLLEESFRFGQIGEPDSATAPSTPARAKPNSGLGISDVHGSSTTSLAADGPGAGIQAKDFEAEDTHTDDENGNDTAKADEQNKDEDISAAPADEAGDASATPANEAGGEDGQVPEIVTSAEEGGEGPRTSTDEPKQDEGSENGTAPGTPTSASASVSRSGSIKPPRPARSTARNSPKPPTAPSPPASPSPDKTRPVLPARKAVPSTSSVPPPPPRRNASHAPSAADSANSTASTMAAGWEDRCWSEVIRLKEAVFWTRVAALAAGGEAVSSRGARVWQ